MTTDDDHVKDTTQEEDDFEDCQMRFDKRLRALAEKQERLTVAETAELRLMLAIRRRERFTDSIYDEDLNPVRKTTTRQLAEAVLHLDEALTDLDFVLRLLLLPQVTMLWEARFGKSPSLLAWLDLGGPEDVEGGRM
jgi:hypothetical protein